MKKCLKPEGALGTTSSDHKIYRMGFLCLALIRSTILPPWVLLWPFCVHERLNRDRELFLGLAYYCSPLWREAVVMPILLHGKEI